MDLKILVAAAAAAADATAASGGFPREPRVFRHRASERIAISPHGISGECGALPRLDHGSRATTKQTGTHDGAEEKNRAK